MKKILLPLAAFALMVSACNNTPMYSISGTVAGVQDGNVFLLTSNKGVTDTLATAKIEKGNFKMQGKVDDVTVAYLVVENSKGYASIFLDNNKFTAAIDPENNYESKVEGSEIQALANQFITLTNTQYKLEEELSSSYKQARQDNDTVKADSIRQLVFEGRKALSVKEDSLINANSDSYIAAYMTRSKMSSNLDELTEQYNKLGEKAKNSTPGQDIAKKIEDLKKVAVGATAPDFTLATSEGDSLSMHSIKAKVKLIDFWASWCGPCRGENPHVVEIYKEFSPKGLEIIGVSLDQNKEAWLKAIEEDGLVWKHVSDLKGWNSSAAALYSVRGIPHTVLLDENNVIIAKDLRGDELKNKIAEILN